MRYGSFIAAALLLFSVSGSQAQTSVLLPCEGANCNANNANTTSVPNLGLAPSDAQTPTNQATPQLESNKEVIAPKPVTSDAPQTPQDLPKPPVLNSITPGGAASTNYQTEEERLQSLARQYNIPLESLKPTFSDPEARKYYEQKERRKIREPIIVNDADALSNPASVEEITSKFPNKITVSVSSSYMWGNGDIKTVQDALGYGPKEISLNCQFMVKTKLSTDKGAYGAKVFSGQQGVIKYEGTYSNLAYVGYAVCKRPTQALPKKGSVIFKMGNMYALQLKSFIACNAPAQKSFSFVTLRYLGDNKGECGYQ